MSRGTHGLRRREITLQLPRALLLVYQQKLGEARAVHIERQEEILATAVSTGFASPTDNFAQSAEVLKV